ncbi:MAG: phospho-N-acetylmuramoyl-pentapeptide-transferase [Planctomycetes bacterium]|nr:phospho-N-acetylmuramoyl-pentapeptide-transferase [Planctomycetota bacterium]
MLHMLFSRIAASAGTGVALRAGLAALTAWAISAACARPILSWLARRSVREKTEKTPIEDENLRRSIAAKSGTPTMGGLILLSGLIGATVLWADLTNRLLLVALACACAMAALGVIDDAMKLSASARTDRGLKVRYKLLAQVCVGALLGLALLASPGGRQWALSGLMRPLATLSFLAWSGLVVATMSNATNVTDGLDGLLAGLAPPAAIVLGAACWVSGMPDAALRLGVSHVEGAAELAVFCGALSGGCLGFLMLNRHPARIFMGDTGSMAIGGALGMVALAAGQELVMALAGLVFLIEFGSSLLQVGSYHLLGRRVLPMAPIHHIFQKRGYPEPRIVRGFYLAGLAAALIAFTTIGF